MEDAKQRAYPHVIPDIENWPIYMLSESRQAFVREIEQFTLNRLKKAYPTSKITDIIAHTAYLERIRIQEEPWKVDPPNDRQFWNRLRKSLVRKSFDRPEPEAAANNEALLKDVIHRYAEEIVGTFNIKTFLFARKFLTFFFNRLLQAKLRGFLRIGGARRRLTEKLSVEGPLETVRALASKGVIVVVPTHFSNLDSILIGYMMDIVAGLPSFSYGAGLNLYNTGYTAYFLNRLGAYRVDRRKKNEIYLETLKAMSNLSIQRGTNSLFFPGGTRSRSGMMETKLKLGLLSTTVEAQRSLFQRGESKKVFIVPLVTSYHFVLEAQYLIEQYLKQIGKERFIKAQDNFFKPLQIARFVWKVLAEGNDITFSFGQPMDVLGNPVDAQGESYDQYGNRIALQEYFELRGHITEDLQRESEYTKLLGEKIVGSYFRYNIVLDSHLVAFAAFEILKKENARLDLYGVLRLPPTDYAFAWEVLTEVVGKLQKKLNAMEKAGELRLSASVRGDKEALIRNGIGRMGTFHLKKPLKFDKKGQVVSENFLLLYFYHNRLENYGLASKVSWTQPSMEVAQPEAENL
ncbi:MAG: 1-acyl-sn-glycerol-3-phosphate acyltransferase [Saprospiraceae bacterium]